MRQICDNFSIARSKSSVAGDLFRLALVRKQNIDEWQNALQVIAPFVVRIVVGIERSREALGL